MEAWLEQAKPAQRDVMAGLQLDYRFAGDNFGSKWWVHFQELGFQYNGVTYTLPTTAPSNLREHEYDVNTIYGLLDGYAIPQQTSCFEALPPKPPHEGTDGGLFWRQLRKELIYRIFYGDVDRMNLITSNVQKPIFTRPTIKKPRSKLKKKKSDSGADLFRSKKSKKRKGNPFQGSNAVSDTPKFPTVGDYTRFVSDMDLTSTDVQEDLYSHHFEDWRFLMTMNHSILLYGAGSKQTLMNKFVVSELEKDGDVLTLDGFDKDICIEAVLELIEANWRCGKKKGRTRHSVRLREGKHIPALRGDASIVQRAIGISKTFAERCTSSFQPLYLVLNNIDGPTLRNPTAQEALSALVHYSQTKTGLNSVRLVASVDHVNSPLLLWDSHTAARFRWTWKQVNTGRPYSSEVTYGHLPGNLTKASVRAQNGRVRASMDSVEAVLKSLAPRNVQTLQQLAQLQLQEPHGWVQYTSIRDKCHLACIGGQDSVLRHYLQELIDHGCVNKQNSTYRIPYASVDLKRLIAIPVRTK